MAPLTAARKPRLSNEVQPKIITKYIFLKGIKALPLQGLRVASPTDSNPQHSFGLIVIDYIYIHIYIFFPPSKKSFLSLPSLLLMVLKSRPIALLSLDLSMTEDPAAPRFVHIKDS